jgi:histone deacetylase complex regulatory component SIN3
MEESEDRLLERISGEASLVPPETQTVPLRVEAEPQRPQGSAGLGSSEEAGMILQSTDDRSERAEALRSETENVPRDVTSDTMPREGARTIEDEPATLVEGAHSHVRETATQPISPTSSQHKTHLEFTEKQVTQNLEPTVSGKNSSSKRESDSTERAGAARTVLKLDPQSEETSAAADRMNQPAETEEGSQARALRVEDALAYLEQVKAQFEDRPRIYAKFLDIMKEFKAQTIDTPGVIEQVTRLFRGYPNLVLGFNTFLPAGYKIELSDCLDAAPVHAETPGPANERDDAKITVAAEDTRARAPYPGAITRPSQHAVPDAYRVAEMSSAMGNAHIRAGPEAFRAFQPSQEPKQLHVPQGVADTVADSAAVVNAQAVRVPPSLSTFNNEEFDHAIQYVNKVKQRFQNQPAIYQRFLNILQAYQRDGEDKFSVLDEVSQIFRGHPDLLEEFKSFLPDSVEDEIESARQITWAKRAASNLGATGGPTKRTKRSRRSETAQGVSLDGRDAPLQAALVPQHLEQTIATAPHASSTAATALSGLSPISYGARAELLFFEKLRERMEAHQFHEFIKCLSLYNQEIIGRTELMSLADELFGHRHILSEAFRTFLDACAPARRSKHPTDAESAMSGVEAALAILEGRAPPSATAPPVDGLWRYKSLSEAAAESRERCDTSYKRIPSEFQSMPCSGRGELEKQVLNDIWVSVPTGSEEGSFKHMRRNQFEDNLFRCEDDRYELDMVIETNAATIHKLEPLAMVIAHMSDEEKAKHMLAEHALSAVHYRAIERVYGAHGPEMVMHVKMQPSVAVPIVLNRLKQKDEEWRRARVEMNKLWREICERNYFKSLDHRSFYFRQSDKRTISVRGLLQDIHDIAEVRTLMEAITVAVFAANIMAGSCDCVAFGCGFGHPALSREFENSWRARQVALQCVHGGTSECAHASLSAACGDSAAAPERDPFAVVSALEPPCLRFRLRLKKAHQDLYALVSFLSHLEYGPMECAHLLQFYAELFGRFFGINLHDPGVRAVETPGECTAPVVREETDSELADVSGLLRNELARAADERSAGDSPAASDSVSRKSSPDENFCAEMDTRDGGNGLDPVILSLSEEVPSVRPGEAPAIKAETGSTSVPGPKRNARVERMRYRNDSVLFADESLYILMRLYEIAFQRLAAARQMAQSQYERQRSARMNEQRQPEAAMDLKSISDSLYNPEGEARAEATLRAPSDIYREYMDMLRRYLSNAIDSQEYEDYCRRVLGPESYVLFTLDKVLFKLVKQAYNTAQSRLVALYFAQEQDLVRGLVPDGDGVTDAEAQALCIAEVSYCIKALQILRDERGGNLYRFQVQDAPGPVGSGASDLEPKEDRATLASTPAILTVTLLTSDEGIPRRRDTAAAAEAAASYLGFFAWQGQHQHQHTLDMLPMAVDARKLYAFERSVVNVPLERSFASWCRRLGHATSSDPDRISLYETWKRQLMLQVLISNGLESKMSLNTNRLVHIGETCDELLRRKQDSFSGESSHMEAAASHQRHASERARRRRLRRWHQLYRQWDAAQKQSTIPVL